MVPCVRTTVYRTNRRSRSFHTSPRTHPLALTVPVQTVAWSKQVVARYGTNEQRPRHRVPILTRRRPLGGHETRGQADFTDDVEPVASFMIDKILPIRKGFHGKDSRRSLFGRSIDLRVFCSGPVRKSIDLATMIGSRIKNQESRMNRSFCVQQMIS
jgi:hypothetical protein